VASVAFESHRIRRFPYQCFSAFAGNPLLVSLERLRDQGLLQASDLAQSPLFPEDFVDYGPVIEFRMASLGRAAQVFFADGSRADHAAFDRFCESASPWLDDYALFMACKDEHHGTIWTSWDAQIRNRDAHALSEWSRRLVPEVNAYKFWQFDSSSSGSSSRFIAGNAASVSWATSRSMLRTTAQISGLIPICIISTIRAARPWSPAAARLFQRHPDSSGGIRFIAGTCWPPADTSGGRALRAPPFAFRYGATRSFPWL